MKKKAVFVLTVLFAVLFAVVLAGCDIRPYKSITGAEGTYVMNSFTGDLRKVDGVNFVDITGTGPIDRSIFILRRQESMEVFPGHQDLSVKTIYKYRNQSIHFRVNLGTRPALNGHSDAVKTEPAWVKALRPSDINISIRFLDIDGFEVTSAETSDLKVMQLINDPGITYAFQWEGNLPIHPEDAREIAGVRVGSTLSVKLPKIEPYLLETPETTPNKQEENGEAQSEAST